MFVKLPVTWKDLVENLDLSVGTPEGSALAVELNQTFNEGLQT